MGFCGDGKGSSVPARLHICCLPLPVASPFLPHGRGSMVLSGTGLTARGVPCVRHPPPLPWRQKNLNYTFFRLTRGAACHAPAGLLSPPPFCPRPQAWSCGFLAAVPFDGVRAMPLFSVYAIPCFASSRIKAAKNNAFRNGSARRLPRMRRRPMIRPSRRLRPTNLLRPKVPLCPEARRALPHG